MTHNGGLTPAQGLQRIAKFNKVRQAGRGAAAAAAT